MYIKESFELSSGNDPSSQIHLPPPPPLPHPVQQAYMYPSPSASSASQAQLIKMQGTAQSYTNTSSQMFRHHLPSVSMSPPPPPLPSGSTMPPSQTFPYQLHPQSSSQLSVPIRSLEPPERMPLPPPPPRSSPNAFETVSLKGIESLPVVEDTGPSKANDEPSLPFDKVEEIGSSHICTDPDIEMEDDITLSENEEYTSQPLHRSRQASSSPYSGRTKIVPESDMYDPFVDSFEPSSLKLDSAQEHEPSNVPKKGISSNRTLNKEKNNQDVDIQALTELDMTARVSVSSNKPPDIEENTIAEDDVIGAMVSKEKDEFGENADNESHETETPNEDPKVSEGDRDMRESGDEPKEKDSSS